MVVIVMYFYKIATEVVV